MPAPKDLREQSPPNQPLVSSPPLILTRTYTIGQTSKTNYEELKGADIRTYSLPPPILRCTLLGPREVCGQNARATCVY